MADNRLELRRCRAMIASKEARLPRLTAPAPYRLLVTLALLAASPAWGEPASAPATLPTGDDPRFRSTMAVSGTWAVDLGVELSLDAGSDSRLEQTGFPLPRHGRISSGFGVRSDPLGLGMRMHSGIDLPSALGTPVRATLPGQVRFSGWAGGYGNMVEIDHSNGVTTRYGHLSRALVREGQPVAGGALIGLVGSTGRSTGSHLHYEVRIAGRAVNPLTRIALAVPSGSSTIAANVSPELPAVARWAGWSDPGSTRELPMAIIQ